jgi:hypothetical protein
LERRWKGEYRGWVEEGLVEDGFETPLKQWSGSTVFSIQPPAVADIKPMECFAKLGLSALQLEMVVVTH